MEDLLLPTVESQIATTETVVDEDLLVVDDLCLLLSGGTVLLEEIEINLLLRTLGEE